MARIEVELRKAFEHREGPLLVLRVSLEELERAPRRADSSVGHHQLPPRLAGEIGGVLRVRMRHGELDRAHEGLEGLTIVLEVEVHPGRFVDRVAVDAVRLGWELGDLRIELKRGLHLPLREEILGEGEVGVRNVAALGEALDQLVIDLPRLVLALALFEPEGQGEEHLIHPREIRMIVGEREVGADRLISDGAQGLLRLALPLARAPAVLCVLLLPACLEDLLVEGADPGVHGVLHLEEGLRQAEQDVRTLWVVAAHVAHEAVQNADLIPEDIAGTSLHRLPVAEHGFIDRDRGSLSLLGNRLLLHGRGAQLGGGGALARRRAPLRRVRGAGGQARPDLRRDARLRRGFAPLGRGPSREAEHAAEERGETEEDEGCETGTGHESHLPH
ncbi:MAG: hypothetical protein OEY14_10480 [Myxococcales bacterium]|nr:hypothetical protein [Myxococcales bacterium]